MDREKIRKDIDLKVRLIDELAWNILDILAHLDTDTIDSLGLYEYGNSISNQCTRRTFFHGANAIERLREYFNDEYWATYKASLDKGGAKND